MCVREEEGRMENKEERGAELSLLSPEAADQFPESNIVKTFFKVELTFFNPK